MSVPSGSTSQSRRYRSRPNDIWAERVSVDYSQRPETASHGAIVAGLAASEVRPATPSRFSLSLYNAGTVTVYLGTSDAVTVANGIPLPAGAEREIQSTTAVWVISGTASQDLRYWEESYE